MEAERMTQFQVRLELSIEVKAESHGKAREWAETVASVLEWELQKADLERLDPLLPEDGEFEVMIASVREHNAPGSSLLSEAESSVRLDGDTHMSEPEED